MILTLFAPPISAFLIILAVAYLIPPTKKETAKLMLRRPQVKTYIPTLTDWRPRVNDLFLR